MLDNSSKQKHWDRRLCSNCGDPGAIFIQVNLSDKSSRTKGLSWLRLARLFTISGQSRISNSARTLYRNGVYDF